MGSNYPTRDKVFDNKGEMSEPWRKWYDEIGGSRIPYRKYKSMIYDVTTKLFAKDLGRVVKVNNGTSKIQLTLPTVEAKDVDSWITIMRLGTGPLIIQTSDSDTIEDSSSGGRVVCEEVDRVCANITLFLAEETKWAILGASGIWKVY